MAEVARAIDIAELVAQHHGAVYGYAYRLTGAAADAEDLSQQVFLIAQQKVVQLRDPAAARGWLFTILRRCFSKNLKRNRALSARRLPLNVENVPAEIPSDEAPIDPEQLQVALDELPPKYRLVVVMFFFEDCSYRQIAEQLKVPIGTVMSRLARAKARLKSRLFDC